jgi:hypothetical protein
MVDYAELKQAGTCDSLTNSTQAASQPKPIVLDLRNALITDNNLTSALFAICRVIETDNIYTVNLNCNEITRKSWDKIRDLLLKSKPILYVSLLDCPIIYDILNNTITYVENYFDKLIFIHRESVNDLGEEFVNYAAIKATHQQFDDLYSSYLIASVCLADGTVETIDLRTIVKHTPDFAFFACTECYKAALVFWPMKCAENHYCSLCMIFNSAFNTYMLHNIIDANGFGSVEDERRVTPPL